MPSGAKGQTVTYAKYNYLFSTPTETINPNNVKTKQILDALGRVKETKITNPQNTATETTVATYQYNHENFPISIETTKYAGVNKQNPIVSKVYLDGQGRVVQTLQKAEGRNKYISTSIVSIITYVFKS